MKSAIMTELFGWSTNGRQLHFDQIQFSRLLRHLWVVTYLFRAILPIYCMAIQ